MSQMQEQKIRSLETRIEQLEKKINEIVKAHDANANALRIVAATNNVLSRKVGISNEDVVHEIENSLARKPIQPANSGANSSDSGSKQPNILSPESKGGNQEGGNGNPKTETG